LTQPQVKTVCDGFIDSVFRNQTYKAAASHAVDFEVPIYNVWKQQEKTAEATVRTWWGEFREGLGRARRGNQRSGLARPRAALLYLCRSHDIRGRCRVAPRCLPRLPLFLVSHALIPSN